MLGFQLNRKPMVFSFTLRENPPFLSKGFIYTLHRYPEKITEIEDMFSLLVKPPRCIYFLHMPKHHYFHVRLMPYIAHEIAHIAINYNPYSDLFFSKLTWIIGVTRIYSQGVFEETLKESLGKRIYGTYNSYSNFLKKMKVNMDIVSKVYYLRELYCDVLATLISGMSYPLTLISTGMVNKKAPEIILRNHHTLFSALRLYACFYTLEELEYSSDDTFNSFRKYLGNITGLLEKKGILQELIDILKNIISETKDIVPRNKSFDYDSWKYCIKEAEKIVKK